MDRRKFLRAAALLPALPVLAVAGPTPEGVIDEEVDGGRFVVRYPEYFPHRTIKQLRKAVATWKDDGGVLILPDCVEILAVHGVNFVNRTIV